MLKNSTTFYRGGYILLISLLLVACNENKHLVDTSGSEVNIELERYEDMIFSVRDVNSYEQLYKRDTVFFKYYLNNIIGDVTGGRLVRDKSMKAKGLTEFVQFRDMQDLYNEVQKQYPNLDDIQEQLSSAFTYYHYHFPDKTIPGAVTFVSPFRSAIACFEEKIGIGLDMFLGSEFEPYQTPSLSFPQYMIQKFRRDYIVPNAVKAWLLTEFEPVPGQDRFLDRIVYEGKILYTMDALFPNLADSLKIGYAANQLEWNEKNEFQIFEHVNSKELLFTSDERSFIGLLREGPFSKGENIPQESSPRIGVWLGWQIVRQYMDENPKLSPKDLWNETDNEKILRESKYKP